MEEKKDIQLIDQGTYGCVFRPNIQCKTMRPESRKYLSKIQKTDKYSQQEIEIGKKIQTIPKYAYYFAPILENCPVSVSTIHKYKLDKTCGPIRETLKMSKTNSMFTSNKIRYVGKQTLDDYLYNQITKCEHIKDCMNGLHQYIKKIIRSNLYLLKGIQKLSEKGIVHLDIKANNVMYDSTNDVFIFIDFGFAEEEDRLDPSVYEKQSTRPFGIVVDHYVPWCVEIQLLSYIARIIKQTPQLTDNYVSSQIFNSKNNSIQKMKECATKYISTNTLFQNRNVFTQMELQDFEKRLHTWIDGFAGKTYKQIWSNLIEQLHTWDHYSICAMYLCELQQTNLFQFLPQNQSKEEAKTNPLYFLVQYVNELKDVLLSTPNQRKIAKQTHDNISKIFHHLKKQTYETSLKQLTNDILSKKNIDSIHEEHQRNKLKELHDDEKRKQQ